MQDSGDVREKMRSIFYTDWKTMGFSKGTLHYMKKNGKDDNPFSLNVHVMRMILQWNEY